MEAIKIKTPLHGNAEAETIDVVSTNIIPQDVSIVNPQTEIQDKEYDKWLIEYRALDKTQQKVRKDNLYKLTPNRQKDAIFGFNKPKDTIEKALYEWEKKFNFVGWVDDFEDSDFELYLEVDKKFRIAFKSEIINDTEVFCKLFYYWCKENKDALFVEFWMYNKKKHYYTIIHSKLIEFLQRRGYAKIYQNESMQSMLIKVTDNVVSEVSSENIKDFLWDWMRDNQWDLLNTFAKGPYNYIGKDKLELLKPLTLNFHQDTRNKCFVYYKNGYLEITANQIELKSYKTLDGYIWASSIIQRDYIEDINSQNCEFSRFFKNITNNDNVRYNGLRTAVGYLAHRYKNRSIVKAVILNDEALNSQTGGTGKGIVFQALQRIRTVQHLDCRNRLQNQFIFQNVNQNSDIIHFEDIQEGYDFGKLFNALSSDMDIENKNANIFTIPFEEAPKIGLSTNFVVQGNNVSNERRRIDYELHNHYHANLTPYDEFGHLLFDEWDNTEWSKFDNWMAGTIQLYLQNGIIEPPTVNVSRKKMISDTNDDFINWIEDDFDMRFNVWYNKGDLQKYFNDKYNHCDCTQNIVKWTKRYCIEIGVNCEERTNKINGKAKKQIMFKQ